MSDGLGILLALAVVFAPLALAGNVNPDYTDWRVALTKTFAGGWNSSAAAVGATNDAFYCPPVGGLSLANSDTRDLNRPVLVLQVGRSFLCRSRR